MNDSIVEEKARDVWGKEVRATVEADREQTAKWGKCSGDCFNSLREQSNQ